MKRVDHHREDGGDEDVSVFFVLSVVKEGLQ